jgi:hypothetical protein
VTDAAFDQEAPRRPYKGFGNYGPQDMELFAGRDEDTERFAELVARSDVRLVVLHGASGCGKSSFLRAGVIPYLERRNAGFAFLKNPDDPGLHPDDSVATAVFIRSTADPLDALAHAVFRLADRGYEFMSADGFASLKFPEAKRGCDSAMQFAALVAAAPRELVHALESLSGAMPHKPVLIVDQAEEVVSLRGHGRREERADAFFTFLNAFAATRWRLSLIVSLRSDFFGVFRFRLRQHARDGDVAIHDYYLDELNRAEMIDAIVRPTLPTPLGGLGVPRELFRFSYEPGLPERIADDIATAADESGLVIGTLPFLQVVCDSLYKETKPPADTTGPWVIQFSNYVARAEVDTIAKYVDRILDEFLGRPARGPRRDPIEVERSHWKQVLNALVRTRPNGLVTTDLKTVDELRAVTNKVEPDFDAMVDYLAADEQSVLRRESAPESFSSEWSGRLSLRHDAIGLALRAWQATEESVRLQLVSSDVMRQCMPRIERLELKCAFDESGSGEQVRRWVGIRSPQTVVDYRIPYGFAVSPPGRVIVPPEGMVADVADAVPSVLPVRFVEKASNPQRVHGYVQIGGTLGPETGFVGFEVRQRFERAFLMSRSAVEQAYAHEEWQTEYVGIYVSLPTQSLRLEVAFPPSFRSPGLKAGVVVFFGRGEKRHEAEIERIAPSFRSHDAVAVLEVDDPLPGLQYGIYWMPPN